MGRLIRMASLRLGDLMTDEELLKLVQLCIYSELPWAPHALACLLQDALDLTQSAKSNLEHEGNASSWRSIPDLLADETLCETSDAEENSQAETATKPIKILNSSSQLPSVYESDDSEELSDFLDDILERGRHVLRKPCKAAILTYNGSSAVDCRLETGVEVQSEITLKHLIMLSTHQLARTVTANLPSSEPIPELPNWPESLLTQWQISENSPKSNWDMLIACFESLFRNFPLQTANNIDNTLQLWLTLNCPGGGDKFSPGTMPVIKLSPEAVNCLISAIAWSGSLSLRTWCSALQTLTLVCNIPYCPTTNTTQWHDSFEANGMVHCMLNHADFVQFFLRLLSGTGLIFSEKPLVRKQLQGYYVLYLLNIFRPVHLCVKRCICSSCDFSCAAILSARQADSEAC